VEGKKEWDKVSCGNKDGTFNFYIGCLANFTFFTSPNCSWLCYHKCISLHTQIT